MAEDKQDSIDTKAVDITVDALDGEVVIPSFVVALSPMLQAAVGKNWNKDRRMKLPYTAAIIHTMIAQYVPPITDYLQLPKNDGSDWFEVGKLIDRAGNFLIDLSDTRYSRLCQVANNKRFACSYKDVVGIIYYSYNSGADTDLTISLKRGQIAVTFKSRISTKLRGKDFLDFCFQRGLEKLFEKTLLQRVEQVVDD